VPTYNDLRLNKVIRHGKASTVPTGTKNTDKIPDSKEHHHNATDLTGKVLFFTTKNVSQNPTAYKQVLTPYHPKMVGSVAERHEADSGAVRSRGGLNKTVLKRMTNGHTTSAMPNPVSVCESLETAVFIFCLNVGSARKLPPNDPAQRQAPAAGNRRSQRCNKARDS
jgi:hypothetical protein